ncbi:MAG: TIGR03085 family protein [Acidothermus sp.]|nr:TIGR03085 family protein [Acidothermus sp.]
MALRLEPAERAALADLLLALGPEAPTLCAGWQARHLAAHLVLRESKPLAAMGITLRPLRPLTEKTLRRLADGDFALLVERIRTGPPWWSPAGLPALREAVNGIEFFVHHEDVRRARPGWQPRPLPAAVEDELWRRLRRLAPLVARGAAATGRSRAVELRRTDTGDVIRTRRSQAAVTVVAGPPSELLLWIFGRRDHARVTTS